MGYVTDEKSLSKDSISGNRQSTARHGEFFDFGGETQIMKSFLRSMFSQAVSLGQLLRNRKPIDGPKECFARKSKRKVVNVGFLILDSDDLSFHLLTPESMNQGHESLAWRNRN